MDLLENPLNPNKRLKEEFVSNLTGSSLLEIAALSTIVPVVLIVLRKWSSFSRANVYAGKGTAKKDDDVTLHRKDWWSCMVALIVDYFCVILPILLIFTVLSEWAYICTIVLILLLSFAIIVKRSGFHYKAGSQHSSTLRTVISSYRVSVVVVTCLCILAVDFKIYPRRYAKTETYGTGLMDLGVGSFVVANALVSRQARNLNSVRWMDVLRSVSPLVILGFGRLIFTTGVDYQVHIGEYGVHWNFFFTLAAVSILTSIISIRPNYCGILGLLILTGYQMILALGLSEYLISNERKAHIISQNKEGLFSIFGYWGMYLIGVFLGYQLFFANYSSAKDGNMHSTRVKIWFLSALFWLITVILDKYVERVSRRMCNLAYVTLVFAQNFQVLSILTLADLFSAERNLVLEDAFNQNMLGSFLVANVLTGLVNLSIDTLSTSSMMAFAILAAYSFTLSVVVGLAWFYGLKVKFW
ncbi:Uncharacterized protein ACMD2_02163 [Ananas comosus]|uniref:Uncharacterized protein n=1 Tax=Ananas comosus TaxID=4615 RepID=A0A199VPS0_ANACO|nr:Uncharacterized protein ACMD2_02163 [Ananas comosus]